MNTHTHTEIFKCNSEHSPGPGVGSERTEGHRRETERGGEREYGEERKSEAERESMGRERERRGG